MRRDRPSTYHAAILMVVALTLAACGLDGGDLPDSDDGPPSSGGGADIRVLVVDDRPADDLPIVDVATALAANPDQRVHVAGALFVAADGSALLCDAIAESFPPQCGGARVALEGLDLDGLELEEANGVRWSERVELTGSIE